MPEIEIIDKPGLKGFFKNIGEWSFTMVMWGLWLYFFLPILNIILWLLGIRYFYTEVIGKGGFGELFGLAGRMGWTILIVFGILRLWGFYCYRKFGRLTRRNFPLPTTVEQLSDYSKIPADHITELHAKKEILWDPEMDMPRAPR